MSDENPEWLETLEALADGLDALGDLVALLATGDAPERLWLQPQVRGERE